MRVIFTVIELHFTVTRTLPGSFLNYFLSILLFRRCLLRLTIVLWRPSSEKDRELKDTPELSLNKRRTCIVEFESYFCLVTCALPTSCMGFEGSLGLRTSLTPIVRTRRNHGGYAC